MPTSIKPCICLVTLCTLCLLIMNGPAFADPVSGAARIRLGKTCADQNCFTDTSAMLNWVWNTRNPDATSPLAIDVDPGVYVLPSSDFCNGKGHVTVHGSGRGNSVLTGGGASIPGLVFNVPGVVVIRNCVDMTFEHLTIRVGGGGGSLSGVYWYGNGNSEWTDVSVEAGYYGWADNCDTSQSGGTHRWWGSRISTDGNYFQVGYFSKCGHSELFGSEVSSQVGNTGGAAVAMATVRAAGANSKVELYGSQVRSLLREDAVASFHAGSDPFYGQVGLYADDSAEVHIHGGIVSVQSKNPDLDATLIGVRVRNGGTVHTPDTAFGMPTGGGNITAVRVLDEGGKPQTPFQWPHSNVAPSISSVTGADMYIETDCLANGSCDGGAETHIMVYNSTCDYAGAWFDTTTGRCRGVVAP